MKFIAETTGDFMIHDLSTGDSVQAARPSVVYRSPFLESRIAINQVVKVADVPEEADDTEFAEFWHDSDGDRELAIASFLSKFDPEIERKPVSKPSRGAK